MTEQAHDRKHPMEWVFHHDSGSGADHSSPAFLGGTPFLGVWDGKTKEGSHRSAQGRLVLFKYCATRGLR